MAIFDELKRQGIKPIDYYGDKWAQAQRLVELDLPDYDYLVQVPDFVHRLQAREFIAGGMPPLLASFRA